MNHLETCSACGGFLAPSSSDCPHCGLQGVPSRARRVVKGAVAIALGGTVALTLMACYGPPVMMEPSSPTPSGSTTPPDGGGTTR